MAAPNTLTLVVATSIASVGIASVGSFPLLAFWPSDTISARTSALTMGSPAEPPSELSGVLKVLISEILPYIALSWLVIIMLAIGEHFRNASVKKEKVTIYAGFTEHAYRLVFNFEDRYGPAHLTTVLPCGTVENEKDLKAEKEKGLIAYTFPQTMIAEVAQKHKGPFVWKREDGTFAVVQTWTTNYNDKFKTEFHPKTTNPDPARFKPQAVEEFRKSMENLFGQEAAKHEILYCHKVSENTKPLYIGTSELLLKFLHEDAGIREGLDITEMTNDGGFVARSVDGKGKEGSTPFKFSPGKQYALYTKQGWNTMACITPLDQFNDGRVYHASSGTWKPR